MSEPLRIAVVVEGPTDTIVLQAIVRSLLAGADFEFQTLQPEGSAAFGSNGAGWGGVYRWSRQVAEEGGGSLSGFLELSPSQWDLLMIHVDADVADKTYASAGIEFPPQNDLPCAKPCPPPRPTTDALQTVLLRWLGEETCPPKTILCTPSKTMDAWVLTALFPDNAIFQQEHWECRSDPAGQLKALPKRNRFPKKPHDYRKRSRQISQAWPCVSATLTEAARFQEDFRRTIHAIRAIP